MIKIHISIQIWICMTSFYRTVTREFVQDSCTQLLMTCGSYCMPSNNTEIIQMWHHPTKQWQESLCKALILRQLCVVGATAGHLTKLHKNHLHMNNCIITPGNFTTAQYTRNKRQCIKRTSPELFNLFKILLNKIFYIAIHITLKQDHKH